MTPSKKFPKKLVVKLSKILGEVETMKKDGHNENQNYDYLSESAISESLRSKLAAASIFVTTSVTKTLRTEKLTEVWTEHLFMDAENEEMLMVQGYGQGQDGGDKGGNKAITGAMKYMLMKNFLVSSHDDAENDKKFPEQKTEQYAPAVQSQHERGVFSGSGDAPKTVQKKPGVRVAFDSRDRKPSARQLEFFNDVWRQYMTKRGITEFPQQRALLFKSLLEWYEVQDLSEARSSQISDGIDHVRELIKIAKPAPVVPPAPQSPQDGVVVRGGAYTPPLPHNMRPASIMTSRDAPLGR